MTNEQYNRFREAVEARYRGRVYKAIQNQIQEVISSFKAGGIVAARRANDMLVNTEITQVVSDIYTQVGLYAANKQHDELKKLKVKRASINQNREWQDEIIEFFRKYLLDKAVLPITATTRAKISEVLEQGIREGWSEDKMVEALRMTDITKARAQVIVRTEAGVAFGHGQWMAANDYEYEVTKTWQSITDTRTRRTHTHGAGVGGQKVELNERFSNGLLFPGDKSGAARETINCRCRMAIKPKRDANGRLIPKNAPAAQQSSGMIAEAIGRLIGIGLGSLINTE